MRRFLPLSVRPLSILLAALAISGVSRAQTTIYLEPFQDNTLYEWVSPTPDTVSNGAGVYLFAGINDVDERRRAVLRFEAAEFVPPGATVTAVSLTLNMSRTIAGPMNVDLHRLQASWGEGESDAAGKEGGGAAPASPGRDVVAPYV